MNFLVIQMTDYTANDFSEAKKRTFLYLYTKVGEKRNKAAGFQVFLFIFFYFYFALPMSLLPLCFLFILVSSSNLIFPPLLPNFFPLLILIIPTVLLLILRGANSEERKGVASVLLARTVTNGKRGGCGVTSS